MTQQQAENAARALIEFLESCDLPFVDLEVHPADGRVLAGWLLERSILRRANLFHEAGLHKLYPPAMRKALRELREEASSSMAHLSASDEYGRSRVRRRIRMGTL